MRFQMSISKEMAEALESERKERMLGTLQEAMRAIVAEHFRSKHRRAHQIEKKEMGDVNPLIV